MQTITLPELELTSSDVDDVCSAVVHAILFTRVIGLYRPMEAHIQTLDISFVCRPHECVPMAESRSQAQLNDDAIRSTVAERVNRFVTRLTQSGRDVLCVKFFETRKTTGWFGTAKVS